MEPHADSSSVSPPPPPDDALVERYLAGECTDAEIARIDAWIRAVPAQGVTLLALRQRATHPWTTPPRFAVSAMHHRLWERLGLHDAAVMTESAHSRRVSRTSHALRTTWSVSRPWRAGLTVVAGAAAAIALVVGVTRHRSRPNDDVGHTYATASGQRATVLLADGSRVTLAPGTTMHVTGDVGTSARSVSLVGEAYFEVAPAPGRPFRVTAGNVTADVLGTSFNVRRYAADSAATIAVVSGKVRVQNPRAHVTLTAGLMSQLSDSTPTASVARVGTDAAAWAQGRLVFNNVPVRDLLTGLGRWYGYDFRVADSALARTLTHARLTAEFRADAPAESIRLLKDLLDVTLTFDDTVVTLHTRSSRAPAAGARHEKTFSPTVEVGR